jgi:hypothetical protein
MSKFISLGNPLKLKLNKNVIFNSFSGLAIAFIFDDIKDLFINEIVLRIVNQKMKRNNIKINSIDVVFDYKKIIGLIVNILISILFIGLLYYYS